jgi:hypothetical protein
MIFPSTVKGPLSKLVFGSRSRSIGEVVGCEPCCRLDICPFLVDLAFLYMLFLPTDSEFGTSLDIILPSYSEFSPIYTDDE